MNNPPKWKFACHCAVSDGVPRRSFYVAVVVGTLLNIINQGDVVLSAGPVDWLKVILTYLVPYAVCTYGAVSAQTRQARRPAVFNRSEMPQSARSQISI